VISFHVGAYLNQDTSMNCTIPQFLKPDALPVLAVNKAPGQVLVYTYFSVLRQKRTRRMAISIHLLRWWDADGIPQQARRSGIHTSGVNSIARPPQGRLHVR
jgi:hypothetical protein